MLPNDRDQKTILFILDNHSGSEKRLIEHMSFIAICLARKTLLWTLLQVWFDLIPEKCRHSLPRTLSDRELDIAGIHPVELKESQRLMIHFRLNLTFPFSRFLFFRPTFGRALSCAIYIVKPVWKDSVFVRFNFVYAHIFSFLFRWASSYAKYPLEKCFNYVAKAELKRFYNLWIYIL